MALGIPDAVEKIGQAALSQFPKTRSVLVHTYRRYVRTYVRLATWLKCGKDHAAPVEPLNLVLVSPNDIKYAAKDRSKNKYLSNVMDGNWDCQLKLFESRSIFDAFVSHFNKDIVWEQTNYYQSIINQINNGNVWKGCRTEDDVQSRFDSYDRLYKSMKKNGYKTQQELEKSTELISEVHELQAHPPELREVTIDIGRDGELIWFWGQHRLCIAKILDIDRIPVRIRVRHLEWQHRKNKLVKTNNLESIETDHPDLLALSQ